MSQASNGAKNFGHYICERICAECGRSFQLLITPPFMTAKRKFCSPICRSDNLSRTLKAREYVGKNSSRERREKAFRLRESGLTYRKVGEEIGVSPNRAKQIVDSFKRKKVNESR